jgi:membrane-associated phospholipid phosphatase
MPAEPAQPLLADSVRPWAIRMLACCVLLVAVLGVLFAHQSRADWFDQAIDSRVVHLLAGHEQLLLWLASPATFIPAGLVSLVMIVVCLLTGRLNGAVLAAAAVPVASALNDAVIKPLVHRTIDGNPAYPSGHVTSIVALTAMVAVLLVLPPRALIPPPVRLLIVVAAGLAVLGVALAVIGLQWHYFTDTVGGVAVGTGTVCALALALDLAAVRRRIGIADGKARGFRRPSPPRLRSPSEGVNEYH